MVKVKGFPGPLYPPDGLQEPSPDSDFVLALKRTLGRIGAWPWDPDGWDDSYSNRFAHGDGWNDPTHAGIEGIQKWAGNLDITGNLGEKTFNFLRSVKVPQGRTHAGEMAMDSVAINLTNAAYTDAHSPAAQVPLREQALKTATAELGTKESPPESNKCKYTAWYGMIGPWCAMFCTWCYDQVGGSPSFDRFDECYAYVPYVVSDARNGRNGLVTTLEPKPGDLVCYDWARDGEYDHVGFFERWISGSDFNAIEGNTSTSNNSNGGEVMRRSRNVNGQGTVFVRVAE
jgi:CHAP domain